MNIQDLKTKADALTAAVKTNSELLVRFNAKLQAALDNNDQAAIQALGDEMDAATKQIQADDAANDPDPATPASN